MTKVYDKMDYVIFNIVTVNAINFVIFFCKIIQKGNHSTYHCLKRHVREI